MPDRNFDLADLRHRVTIVVPGAPPNRSSATTGRADPADVILGTFWARLQPLSGAELVNAKQVKATISHRATLRVNGPLPPTARLIYPGIESPTSPLSLTGRRTFAIVQVLREDEVNGWYDVLTESTP